MKSLFAALFILGVAVCGTHEKRHDKHGRHGPREPPFLRNMTSEAKKQYFNILRNTNETIAAQKQQILAWAQNYSVQAEVQQFEANLTAHKNELKQNVTELLARLPQAYQQLTSIMENENQTPIQLREQMDQFRNASRKEFNVLMFAAGQFRPRRGPGPRGPRHGKPGKGNRGPE